MISPDLRNRRTAAALAGVVLTMGALAWASVPFYDWFCRVTGYGGTTNVASGDAGSILDETVTISFDASQAAGLPIEFRPMQKTMDLRIGETGLAFYEARNLTDRAISLTATYNVAPDIAGYYFSKIECFCFVEQVLQPGQRVEMPVSFFVDPGLVDDRDAGHIRAITLSYTMFETPAAAQATGLSTGSSAPYN